MTYDEVTKMLEGKNGDIHFELDTVTSVKLTGGKKNSLQDRVTKRTVGAEAFVNIGGNGSTYEKLVRENLEKEGKDPSEFELKPRAWGKRIDGTPFVQHNDKYYIECYFLKSGETVYLVDGSVTDEEIEGLPEKKVSENSQGGLEEKVIVRTFSLESIERLQVLDNS